jgi:hypothetical protein
VAFGFASLDVKFFWKRFFLSKALRGVPHPPVGYFSRNKGGRRYSFFLLPLFMREKYPKGDERPRSASPQKTNAPHVF